MSISHKYQIISPLGKQQRRKFGSVFLVEEKSTGDNAVMKAFKKSCSNLHLSARIKHESNFSFDFNGLPKTLDYHENETEIILIRSYAEGITIDQYWNSLKRKQRIPFLIELIEQLDTLFEHLKENKVIHCDIKPSNILIEQKDTEFKVHLIDFGLSLKSDDLDQRNTLFPLGYAAPELLLNQLDLVDQRTDIYALGILIWKLYAERLPLSHPNPSIFTNLQLTHPLPEHHSVPKKIFSILQKMSYKHQFSIPPNRLDNAILKDKLSEAIACRYHNLNEVVADLKNIKRRRFF